MPQRGTIYADLHTHTTASDGSFTPTELVQRAFERGIKAIAITDHDTVAGVEEARTAAKERGMWFTSGIEISATLEGREIHILGYGVDTSNHALLDYANRARTYRRERAERIITRLRELGVKKLTMADVREIAGDGVVGRQHIALAMQRKGLVRTVREAFDKYLADDALAFTAKWEFPIKDAIALIHNAGGLAVVAHPAKVISGEQFDALLAAGLDGVELHHPSHDRDVCQLYALLAEQHELVITGGSDFHGGNKRDGSNIGRYGLMQEDFGQFADKITPPNTSFIKPLVQGVVQMLGLW
jgi:predicted metal-dependent phosphoesterase TrpH